MTAQASAKSAPVALVMMCEACVREAIRRALEGAGWEVVTIEEAHDLRWLPRALRPTALIVGSQAITTDVRKLCDELLGTRGLYNVPTVLLAEGPAQQEFARGFAITSFAPPPFDAQRIVSMVTALSSGRR